MEQFEKLSVEMNRLKMDVDNMDNYIKKIKKTGENMQNDIINLNSIWDGVAKEVFVQQCNMDIKRLYSIIDDMNKFIEEWREANQKYNECEMRVGDLINSIKV